MSIGTKVRDIRKNDLKLTQGEFAKLCGVSRSYISEIEQGRIVGNLNLLTKLSEVTGKPISYFLEDSDSIPVYPYELLDNIIESFIANGLIDSDGNMDEDTSNFLLKTLQKEIQIKLRRRQK